MLGRYLQERGYTSHAPLYQGHGVPPEELVKTDPELWWNDVLEGYYRLKELGYEEIAVAGLSLGGVFSLKIGYTLSVKGIVPMCAPVQLKEDDVMYRGVLSYAKEYKRRERKSPQQIEDEMERFQEKPVQTLRAIDRLLDEVRDGLDEIHAPLFVVQARKDQMIDTASAEVIYQQASSENKTIKWYEQSGHVITVGKEKEQLHEDIYRFLEELDWSV